MQGCSPSSLAAEALTMAFFPSAAPQCIPFVWLTLAGLRSVVGWVRGGRTLRIACAGECRPQSRRGLGQSLHLALLQSLTGSLFSQSLILFFSFFFSFQFYFF